MEIFVVILLVKKLSTMAEIENKKPAGNKRKFSLKKRIQG
jgi:hypothetical protein